MEQLVKKLVQEGILKTPRIIEAFQNIDRADFVLSEYKSEAYGDYPLPIGERQTISQPYTVAFMLELLQPKPGNKILDVGSGSGWTTALLSHIVGKSGKVIGIEVVPELKAFGEKNIAKYNFIKKGVTEFRSLNAENGIPDEAPFTRILSGASAQTTPEAWKKQLALSGRIVSPVKDKIILLIKKSEREFEKKEYPGFAFVPFISEE